jgi:hypothetical protein
MRIDSDLLMIWRASQYTAENQRDFKWSVRFLELNNEAIVYTLIIQYKKTAYLMKTSFNNGYKKFSPGTYILNSTIHELFNKREIDKIDFLTDLPFHRVWAFICLPRCRFIMSRSPIIMIVIGSILKSRYIKQVGKKILNFIPYT